jgi:hypothetical protein
LSVGERRISRIIRDGWMGDGKADKPRVAGNKEPEYLNGLYQSVRSRACHRLAERGGRSSAHKR